MRLDAPMADNVPAFFFRGQPVSMLPSWLAPHKPVVYETAEPRRLTFSCLPGGGQHDGEAFYGEWVVLTTDWIDPKKKRVVTFSAVQWAAARTVLLGDPPASGKPVQAPEGRAISDIRLLIQGLGDLDTVSNAVARRALRRIVNLIPKRGEK